MQFKSNDQSNNLTQDIISQNSHEAYFAEYLKWIDDKAPLDPAERQVTIIARSPASPVIMALVAMSDELKSRDVAVRVVFSDIDPERSLHAAWNCVSVLSEGREHSDILRWASQHGILEAHEQVVYGKGMNWLGDAMRREPGRRDGFDIFESGVPEKCVLAEKSFTALWNFATALPSWMLRDAKERRSSASFAGPDHRALATLSFFRQLEKPDTLTH